MSKIASVALIVAAAASVSPALGSEYCLDRDSKLYRFLGEVSAETKHVHAPHGASWGEALMGAALAAGWKGIAKDHFHVDACPGLTLTPEQIEGIKRIVRELNEGKGG